VTRPKKGKRPAGHQAPARRSAAGRPATVGQTGRRPASPVLLLVVALMWIAAGIWALVALAAGWKLVPGIVFIGLGLLYLRGAAATVARRADRGH
jgi:hypothetical protein